MRLTVLVLSLSLLFPVAARGDTPGVAVNAALYARTARLEHQNAKLLHKLGVRERQLVKLKRANRQRVEYGVSGVVAGFLCIHHYEGAWNDSGAPYWGGLQFDRSFMRSYGGSFLDALGTADRWPPFVQVAVALNAYYSGRSYGPWPNTRRSCGI